MFYAVNWVIMPGGKRFFRSRRMTAGRLSPFYANSVWNNSFIARCDKSPAANSSDAPSRVLLQDPQIIFADEPTSNLDQESAKLVLSRLRRCCTERNRAVVCVLHDAHSVKDFADYELKINAEYPDGWSWGEIPR